MIFFIDRIQIDVLYYNLQITSDLDPYWLYKDPDPQNLMNADPDPGH